VNAPCPSADYGAKLRTFAGLTPTHPYGNGLKNVASEFDYAEWYSLVLRLRSSMEAAWRTYDGVAKTYAPAGVDRTQAIGATVQRLRDRIAALAEPWATAPANRGEQIDGLITLANDTACAWQQVDDAIIAIGATPPERKSPPAPRDTGLGILGTFTLIVGGLAIAGGTIYAAKKLGGRNS
jgi:hypothetical protein